MSVPFRLKKSIVEIPAALLKDTSTPLTAMIEIADRCNEVCVHCYQIQGQKGEMTTDELKKILDELAEMGVLILTFSGGEPTLRKDFIELVEHARKLKFAVKIYSNGLRIPKKMAQKLGELAVQEIQISLYSHRPKIHDWVTGVEGSWEKTVQAAKDLIDAGVKVVLKSPLMSFNADEYHQYIQLVEEIGADYMLEPEIDPREDGNRDPQSLRISNQQKLKAMHDPKLNGVHEFKPSSKEEKLNTSLCGACSGNVHIEANGELRPCTQLNVPVGHALNDGIQEAWNKNTDASKIRSLTWNDIHGCRECDLVPYCSRCFADARKEGGDALGPYLSACNKAKFIYEYAHHKRPQFFLEQTPISFEQALGPFKKIEHNEHNFSIIKDLLSSDDLKNRKQHPWIQYDNNSEFSSETEALRPGELVQIRRPGQKKPKVERIPTS